MLLHIFIFMSNDIWRGRRINKETQSICQNVKPLSHLSSSSICRSLTGMARHIYPSGGLMEGVEGSPPSKTMISKSISSVVDLNWSTGTTISQRSCCRLCCFFFAGREWRWNTLGDLTSEKAAAAHWVQRDKVEQDFKKTWTHWGGGTYEKDVTFVQ